MLETKSYTIKELAAALHTKEEKQDITRKLKSLGIVCSNNGRGKALTFEIQKIENEFKVFCVLELNFDTRTDFHRLAYFIYLFFNYEGFKNETFNNMERVMTAFNNKVTRQTLSKWHGKLADKELFAKVGEYRYYIVSNGKHQEITKELYCQEWRVLFENIDKGLSFKEALLIMYKRNGGMAKKKELIKANAFYTDTIDTLTELAARIIDDDVKTVQSSLPDFDIK